MSSSAPSLRRRVSPCTSVRRSSSSANQLSAEAASAVAGFVSAGARPRVRKRSGWMSIRVGSGLSFLAARGANGRTRVDPVCATSACEVSVFWKRRSRRSDPRGSKTEGSEKEGSGAVGRSAGNGRRGDNGGWVRHGDTSCESVRVRAASRRAGSAPAAGARQFGTLHFRNVPANVQQPATRSFVPRMIRWPALNMYASNTRNA